MGPWRRVSRAFALILCLGATASFPLAAEELTLYLSQYGKTNDTLIHEGGSWQSGTRRLSSNELLLAQFAPPSDARPGCGLFLRDGSLICGTLEALVGEEATVHALTFGVTLKVKRVDLAGAFYPLPLGQPENLPVLGQRAPLMTALRASQKDGYFPEMLPEGLRPGLRNRVVYRNLDALDGRLLRLGNEKALVELQDGRLAAPNRDLVRLIELQTAPLPLPTEKDRAQGAAVVVRLKPGDLLRGRVLKLDERNLVLKTACIGELKIPRDTVEMLYLAGERGSGLTWLSSLRPARTKHTPFFDASFPLRANATCGDRPMRIHGLPCDLGLGMHSRTEVAYDLKPIPGRRLVALVGLDDETHDRGDATAHVLLDGREVWNSGALRPGTEPRHVMLDLGAAQELVLLVDYGPDGDDSGDHVDWGWAALLGP